MPATATELNLKQDTKYLATDGPYLPYQPPPQNGEQVLEQVSSGV